MENVLIASWIEEDLVDRIRGVSESLAVVYEPELLRPPRYPADHKGSPRNRSESEERRWREHLSAATILFDFDQTHLDDLPELAPHVRWIQATSSGIGQFVRRMAYPERMPNTVFTTARGVHARPLAEFVAMAMTMHSRRGLHMLRQQEARAWARFAGRDLQGQTLVLVGLGAVGEEVVRIALAHGMRVVGVRRRPERGGTPWSRPGDRARRFGGCAARGRFPGSCHTPHGRHRGHDRAEGTVGIAGGRGGGEHRPWGPSR
ncbi:MAG: hypothetical protein HKN73_05970 [Gemmatimonadetes bacterium]|nr:hypothetical protein [Gemmatimonadota bacterium]